MVRASSSDESSSFSFEKRYRPGEIVDGTPTVYLRGHEKRKNVRERTHRETTEANRERAYAEEDSIEQFTDKLKNKYINPSSAKLLLACADGIFACQVAEKMQKEFGYEQVFALSEDTTGGW